MLYCCTSVVVQAIYSIIIIVFQLIKLGVFFLYHTLFIFVHALLVINIKIVSKLEGNVPYIGPLNCILVAGYHIA